jgi:hypothetical protein
VSENEVPFYAQTAVLDRYIHSSDPAADPDALEVILIVLETNRDLRTYFFRSGPNAAWAPILWKRGFFDNPPSPQKTEAGYVLPHWDVQDYLFNVAAEVPDVVVNVAESIKGQGWYISQAIRALCHIPGEQAEKLVPKIIEWLDNPQIARSIVREVANLVIHLAQNKRLDAAFALLHALTAPIPPSDIKRIGEMKWGAEAAPKFPDVHIAKGFFERDFRQVAVLDPRRTVTILQEHLCTAIHLEAEALDSPDSETRSWWRSAIEDSDQDIHVAYKHELLRALRYSLETWVQQDAQAVEPLLKQNLRDRREILRRLGLHILHTFPTRYLALVTDELRRVENLDDTGIHHEFFMLLQKGFPHLDAVAQTALVAAICNGPPPARVKQWAEWAQRAEQEGGVDAEDDVRGRVQLWIRDRLWMLKDYLSGKPAETLDGLLEEFGLPEHPEFTHWSSGGFFIRDIAPIERQELAQMSPEELVRYVQGWRPDPRQPFGPEQTTYKGLANLVADVILEAPKRYGDQIESVVLFRPEFAYTLLNRAWASKPATSEAWEFGIRACEILLGDQTVRTDMSSAFETSWTSVRSEIVRLIQLGLNNEQCRIPAHLLPRVRELLLVLLDDPDPDKVADRPPEGWLGHEDPATLAINRVRSRALLALIEYAWFCATTVAPKPKVSHATGPHPKRLEPVVREALTRKLDRLEDSSWAVHSVYGCYLPRLFWLDQEWVETHVDQIFPEGEDEDSVRYYVAAWDSYVIFNRFWPPLFELLRRKYERAIQNLGKGWVTKTHLEPERGLAIHVTWEYLRSEHDLNLPGGSQNLIKLFFQEASPQARGHVPWFFWRVLEDNPNELETYWPRIRAVWKWRAKEASVANHSIDFDDEMRGFAHLLLVAPQHETMVSLWPLLEALLPHITRSERREEGWLAVEKYLAAEVDRDPARAIEFYRLMYDQTPQHQWYYYAREEARRIIEKAAADKNARQEALWLIDLLARRGDHQFRDIYDRYAK